TYMVGLNEQAGWRNGSLAGPPPTQEQMLRVLSSLTELRIRGEYSTTPDTGGLDNVILLAPSTNNAAILVLRGIGPQQLVAEWPASASGFRLQTANILSRADWTDVRSTPVIINGLTRLPPP